MKLKVFVYLLASVIGFAGFPGAEAETLRASALLKPATGVSIGQLPTSGPDFLVRDFAIVDDRVFYIERTRSGSAGEHYVRELPLAGPSSRSTIAIDNCQLYFLSVEGKQLRFFDFAQQELVSCDTTTGALKPLGPTPGYHSMQTFRNGNIIATLEATGALIERGVPSAEEMERMLTYMTREELSKLLQKQHRRAIELGVYDTVLLGPDLAVKKPLSYAYDHKNLSRDGEDKRDRLEVGLNRKLVRMSPDRTLAAVFAIDRPGIKLFDENGNLIHTIESPGAGQIMPPETPLAGAHVLFQSDVVMGDDHLLVVDNPGKKLWALDLKGRVIATFTEPFVVLEAERVGEHLYLRGCSRPHPGPLECIEESRLDRFYYPQISKVRARKQRS